MLRFRLGSIVVIDVRLDLPYDKIGIFHSTYRWRKGLRLSLQSNKVKFVRYLISYGLPITNRNLS